MSHLPTTPDSERCGHPRIRRGLAQCWGPTAGEILGGGEISLPQDRERMAWGAGRGLPQGILQELVHLRLPLFLLLLRLLSPWLGAFPQCPCWGWALCRPCRLHPQGGLQATRPAWVLPSPPPRASSSPGRSPAFTLRASPQPLHAASSEMLRLG